MPNKAEREIFKIRNLEICRLVSEQWTYKKIATKFKITDERVRQIYNASGESKKVDQNTLYLGLYKQVFFDMQNGLSYDELISKHELDAMVRQKLYALGLENIATFYRNKRNKIIIEEYKSGKTAKEIISLENKYLLGGLHISNISMVYNIVSKYNQKRHPHIYNRRKGGCFEKQEIINRIIRLKKTHSFAEIYRILKKENILTISGKKITYATIRYKYNKNKNQKLLKS